MLNKKMGHLFLCCFLVFPASWAWAVKKIVIRKETPTLSVEIKYPQGFAENAVNATIKNFIIQQRATQTMETPETVPADYPGKNSVRIDYHIKYKRNKAISILFTLSTFNRGAAHPSFQTKTFNFIGDRLVNLNDLFAPRTAYMHYLSKKSYNDLMKKKRAEAQWVSEGTKGTQENYQHWYFTKSGLAIVFDTYQVAPYVNGPQTVQFQKKALTSWLRPFIATQVWGDK